MAMWGRSIYKVVFTVKALPNRNILLKSLTANMSLIEIEYHLYALYRSPQVIKSYQPRHK